MTRWGAVPVVAVVLVGIVGGAVPGGIVGGAAPVGIADAAGCSFPTSSTDATGTNVTVHEEPERVVTLNPSAAQTMWEIGAKEKVVGLSTYAMYLDGAETRTDIWSGTGVDAEVVVNLTPDLVLAPNVISNDTVETLRNAGLVVYKFETAVSTAFIYEKTRLTGRLVGACAGATDRVDRMRGEVETVREATAGVDRPRVLYTFFGWTAGEGTFVDMIITTAGGRNVAAEAGITGYQRISDEVVVSRDPEWIVLNSDNPTVPDTPAYNGTTAVEEGNIVVVDANYISQPAPRIVEPMLTIVRALHPEAYEEAKHGVEQLRDEDDDDDGGPPPSFAIVSVSIEGLENSSVARAIELHETRRIEFTVTNSGGPGTFRAGLYVDDSLKRYAFEELDPDETATGEFHYTFSAPGTFEVRINDYRVSNVTVVYDIENASESPATDEAASEGNSTAASRETPSPNPGTPSRSATPSPTVSPTESTGSTATPDGSPAVGTSVTRADSASPSPSTPGSTSSLQAERADVGVIGTRTAGQPGFGVAVALAALLVVGLLGRRRA